MEPTCQPGQTRRSASRTAMKTMTASTFPFQNSLPSQPAHYRPLRTAAPRTKPLVASEVKRGPGYFESTWDLQAGLEIQEGSASEADLEAWRAFFPEGDK